MEGACWIRCKPRTTSSLPCRRTTLRAHPTPQERFRYTCRQDIDTGRYSVDMIIMAWWHECADHATARLSSHSPITGIVRSAGILVAALSEGKVGSARCSIVTVARCIHSVHARGPTTWVPCLQQIKTMNDSTMNAAYLAIPSKPHAYLDHTI